MVIHSHKRSGAINVVAERHNQEIKKAEEKKVKSRKVVKKEEPKEDILPLVEEALASVEE